MDSSSSKKLVSRGNGGGSISPSSYDYSFKILLIGDSGVGKSSLLLSFMISDCQYSLQDLSPTIGVDFKIKFLTNAGKRLKLTIWDTVYDVTRRETFTNLSNIWAKEVDLYSTNEECIKILVGNKVDRESERAVTRQEGLALAQEHKCIFYECSAKTRENVQQCFKDLTLKILERPSLLEQGSLVVKRQILKQEQFYQERHKSCCS
ncbi:ras-related protein RABC2a-like isoform X2 [Daucus carota subsp. sativus]|uniref:ras-related protein RABC2a-like isoform X2 n=1 Tax=Daucus carota subsp. sativus TaxID=79200 RepID=UPI0007EFBF63|nr:PREDICTED: ras-related protein RABC2a-like isoform X2 [Daucus carota subsp. sativus]